MVSIVNVMAGAVLLLAGRRLFWVFVAVAGFYVGFEVTRVVVADRPEWLVWVAAVAAGLIGAIVAIVFQRVAFALGGFYAGAYLALLAAERFFPGAVGVGVFVIGGVLGAIAAALLMDWAIIVLSSMVGATLVVSSLGLGNLGSVLVYAGLMATGIVVQAQLMRGSKRADARG